MATLRNKKILAAVLKETPEKSGNCQSQNTHDSEMDQEDISQVSEEIEGRVTKKLSKQFSRMESRILGALSTFDEFLLNPQVGTCSVAVPRASRSCNSAYREPNGDRSPNVLCPEVMVSSLHSGNLNSSEMEEYPHIVTGVTEEIRNPPNMVTGVQEETPYCYPGTSSERQKKASSTSPPQFRSENKPATFEGDQTRLALQQLATNSISATLNNNKNKNSKLPKSLTTTMPTNDGKSDKLGLFEDFFQKSLKMHN